MGYRFNPPPNWPAPPPGWVPSPGWLPSPEWPALPLGWQLWIDDTAPAPNHGGTAFEGSYAVNNGLTRTDYERVRRTSDSVAALENGDGASTFFGQPSPPLYTQPRPAQGLRHGSHHQRGKGPSRSWMGHHKILTALGAVAALVLIAGGVDAMASSSGQRAAPAAATSPTVQTSASCEQQYEGWKTGPARAVAEKLTTDLNAVSSAGTAEDVPEMTSALQAVGADAAALRQYPMPACADPAGYWNTMLSRIKAAGDNAGSATGLSALLLAEAPLQTVPGLESKLTAELKRTT